MKGLTVYRFISVSHIGGKRNPIGETIVTLQIKTSPKLYFIIIFRYRCGTTLHMATFKNTQSMRPTQTYRQMTFISHEPTAALSSHRSNSVVTRTTVIGFTIHFYQTHRTPWGFCFSSYMLFDVRCKGYSRNRFRLYCM